MTNINEGRNNIQEVLNAEELSKLLNNVIELDDNDRIQEGRVVIRKTTKRQAINIIEKVEIDYDNMRKQMSIVFHREYISNKLYWINLLFDEIYSGNIISIDFNKISNLEIKREYKEEVDESDFDVESHKMLMELRTYEDGNWIVKEKQQSNNIDSIDMVSYFKKKGFTKEELISVNKAIINNRRNTIKKPIIKNRSEVRINADTRY